MISRPFCTGFAYSEKMIIFSFLHHPPPSCTFASWELVFRRRGSKPLHCTFLVRVHPGALSLLHKTHRTSHHPHPRHLLLLSTTIQNRASPCTHPPTVRSEAISCSLRQRCCLSIFPHRAHGPRNRCFTATCAGQKPPIGLVVRLGTQDADHSNMAGDARPSSRACRLHAGAHFLPNEYMRTHGARVTLQCFLFVCQVPVIRGGMCLLCCRYLQPAACKVVVPLRCRCFADGEEISAVDWPRANSTSNSTISIGHRYLLLFFSLLGLEEESVSSRGLDYATRHIVVGLPSPALVIVSITQVTAEAVVHGLNGQTTVQTSDAMLFA